MKKIFFLLLFIITIPIFALDFSFSVEPNFSFNNDSLTYKIYDGTRVNSQLDWNASYLFKAGIGLNFEIENLIVSNANLFSLPLKCGIMYDSDWYTEGIKTNLSVHDLQTDFCYDFSLDLKYRFSVPQNFYFYQVLSLKNFYSQFRAKEGTGWCGDMAHTGLDEDHPWNSEFNVCVEKNGINLDNTISAFFLGLEIQKDFDRFFFDVAFLTAPFVYISSLDHHLNAEGGRYYLLIQNAFFSCYEVDIKSGIHLNKKNVLKFSTDLSFSPELKGVLYFGKKRSNEELADETASFSLKKSSVSVIWNIIF